MSTREDRAFEVKKLQYQRASEDLRYFASLTWKAPSVALIIVTAVIGISSSQKDLSLLNGILVLFAVALLGALILIIGKYRLFEHKSAVVMKQLETDFQNDNMRIELMPVETAESRISIRNWEEKNPPIKMKAVDKIKNVKAYHMLRALMGIFAALLLLFSYEAHYFPFK